MKAKEAPYPRIGIDYILDKNEALEHESQFDQASIAYAELSMPEECFTYEKSRDAEYVYIAFGRTVIKAVSYCDTGHQADTMQQEIERLAGYRADEAVVEKFRAGISIAGGIPGEVYRV